MSRSKKRRNHRSYLPRLIPGPVLRSDPALDEAPAPDPRTPLQLPPLAVAERTERQAPFTPCSTIDAQGRLPRLEVHGDE